MELTLSRVRFHKQFTGGQLYVNKEFFCFTLEDVVREIPGVAVEKWKVHGATAIPVGRYKVVLENSPRFGRDTPTLLNVPGFTFIRVHAGNTAIDTDGCIILGEKLATSGVILPGTSRPAVARFKKWMKEQTDDVWLTIENYQHYAA